MNSALLRFSCLFSVPFTFSLSACSWMKLPKVALPTLPKIDVPFVGDDRTAPSNDPFVPYTLRQPLGAGHTLHVEAYAGQRSPDKLFSGAIMVDEGGKADLGSYGKVKLGGLNASQAVLAMEAAFRKKRGESIINVHIERIEETPLLQVMGAVKHEGIIQFFDGANPLNILPYVGGHDPRVPGRAVFVTRRGVRRFYSDYTRSDVGLEAGDIVIYSDDL